MFCTECGTESKHNALFCTECGKSFKIDVNSDYQQSIATSLIPTATPHSTTHAPTTDMLPDGVKGWSWGACLLNWIWAIGNRTWIGLFALIPYVGFAVAIWLGFKGREMAWRNHKWDSVEQFNAVQKKWSQWGVGLVLVFSLVGVLAAISIPAYQSYVKSAEEKSQSAEIARALSGGIGGNLHGQDGESPTLNGVESGTIDSNADGLPTSLDTLAGTVAKTQMSNGQTAITLNGVALFDGDDAQWQTPLHLFKLSDDREAILVASSGGRGTSCETLFFFLIADKSGVKPGPEFGSCSAQGTYSQQDGKITIKMPTMGGQTVVVFDGTTVIEDSKPVTLAESNDPSK
jgi:type II secretory pathway pseudopilin PulG